VVLKQKARALRAEHGVSHFKAPIEIEDESIFKAVAVFCQRPFSSLLPTHKLTLVLLCREPICFLLSLYTAFLLSILYLFFEAFPLVFTHNHKLLASIRRNVVPRSRGRRNRRPAPLPPPHRKTHRTVPRHTSLHARETRNAPLPSDVWRRISSPRRSTVRSFGAKGQRSRTTTTTTTKDDLAIEEELTSCRVILSKLPDLRMGWTQNC
jgi:hypothetical protein